ncbi:hypothetical protein V500_05612 [Pseudogymnoascus sp. VKM F-4518 (FW-2643)]|nr:hypothetical protein V500_05612 [Pseudogymnoascus sp. VKM F-4518 (FW-2643)]
MAKDFLFNAQKEELWESLGVEPRPSYSDENTVELFKQLLWKLNRYAFYNAKYSNARVSQDPFRLMSGTQHCNRAIKRQKISGSVHGIIINERATEQNPPSQQNKRQKTSGTDHDTSRPHHHIITDEQPVERSPPSQQCSPAPSLVSPWIDAVALSPIDSPPPQVRYTLPPTQHKPPIRIPFFIVRHTGKITSHTLWFEGRFGSKPLEEFLLTLATELECRANEIERIKLVLRVKTRELEGAKAKGKGKLEGFSVLVEPMNKNDGPEPGALEDDFVLCYHTADRPLVDNHLYSTISNVFWSIIRYDPFPTLAVLVP